MGEGSPQCGLPSPIFAITPNNDPSFRAERSGARNLYNTIAIVEETIFLHTSLFSLTVLISIFLNLFFKKFNSLVIIDSAFIFLLMHDIK